MEYNRIPQGKLEGLSTLKFGLANEMWVNTASKLLLVKAGLPLQRVGFGTRTDQTSYVAILDQSFAPQLEDRKIVLLGEEQSSDAVAKRVIDQDLNFGVIAPEAVGTSGMGSENLDGTVYGPGISALSAIEAALVTSLPEEDDELFDVKTIILDRIRNASTQTVNEALRLRELQNGGQLSPEDIRWAWIHSQRVR